MPLVVKANLYVPVLISVIPILSVLTELVELYESTELVARSQVVELPIISPVICPDVIVRFPFVKSKFPAEILIVGVGPDTS